MNLYAALGISCDADDQAIRRAYRMLARRYHPDQGIGSSAEKFREVTEAYETLIDPARRRSYDLSLERASYRPPNIRIDPIVSRPTPFYREDPGVFGRFESERRSFAFQSSGRFDDIFEDWLRLLEELLDERERPW